MKKVIFVFVLIISWCSAYSQLLWKITGKNLKNPSYIFAVSPYINAGYIDSIPGIFRRFSDSEVVIGETSMNKIDNEAQLYKASLLPHPATLDSFIAPENKQLITVELFRVLKLQYHEVSALKPKIITNFYKDEIIRKTLLIENETELSSVFQALGAEKGNLVVGVKNNEDLIKEMADTANLQFQANQLINLMRKNKEFAVEILKMNKLYKSGNIEKYFDEAMKSEFIIPKPADEYLRKIENANIEWVKKIEELIETKTVFAVVDLMQLPGEKGLIQLLRKAGYQVVPE